MQETTDATAIFAPLWRRKWLILGVAIVVGVASYFYYKHATPTFSASTQVYLGAATEEQPAGEKGQNKTSGVEVANQAAIINELVVEEVHKQLRKEGKSRLVKGAKVKAKAAEKSQFLTITAEGHTATGTILLANGVAQAYIRRRDRNRERSINRAIALTQRQLARLEAAATPVKAPSSSSGGKAPKGANTSTILQAATLSTKINQLEAELALSNAQQVKPATHAQLVAPSPRKDAIFGFVIGLVLASIAAYMLGRLDRRLRTLEGIESIFRTQILTALPKVGRPIIHENGRARPSKLLLEPIRRLHTSLQLGAIGAVPLPEPGAEGPPAAGGVEPSGNGTAGGTAAPRPRKILFLSPDPGDGKSTLVADLALVQRDSGVRVAVVEANFRRPVLAKRLDAQDADGQGLAEVLSGSLTIEEAMRRVTPLVADPGGDLPGVPSAIATAPATRKAGSLFLLAGSKTVANPPALLGSEAMAAVIDTLAADHDYVLVDAPSPLEFSDVMPLLRMVDGVVLIARAGHTREMSAQRFVQLLAHSTAAPVIGTIANCVSKSDIARQGLSSVGGQTWLGGLIGR